MLLAVLYWMLAILAVNVLLLFAATWSARIFRRWRDAGRQRFRDAWQPVIHEYMAGDAPMLPALPPARRFDFLLLWLQMAGYVRDEDAARLNELAQALDLPAYVLNLLAGGSRWKRLVAMRAAGVLRLEEAVPQLRREVTGGRMRSGLAAVAALLRIAPDQGAAALQALLGHIRWAPAAVAGVVRSAGPDALKVLAATMLAAPPGAARNLVRVIETLEDATALPALRKRLGMGSQSEAEMEERAALVRALGRLGDESDRARLLPALSSPHALVRMQAAGALGRIGVPEDIWLLLPMLSDADWWVRYRASQSVVALVRGDPRTLAVLRARIKDRYGREALDRAVVEQEGGAS